LVTDAHPKSIALKIEKTRLAGHFEHIICSHELGVPKESADFWSRLQTIKPFDCQRTLFIDDNPRVLRTAQDYGFHMVVGGACTGFPGAHPGAGGISRRQALCGAVTGSEGLNRR